jgi:hypothetical protein
MLQQRLYESFYIFWSKLSDAAESINASFSCNLSFLFLRNTLCMR